MRNGEPDVHPTDRVELDVSGPSGVLQRMLVEPEGVGREWVEYGRRYRYLYLRAGADAEQDLTRYTPRFVRYIADVETRAAEAAERAAEAERAAVVTAAAVALAQRLEADLYAREAEQVAAEQQRAANWEAGRAERERQAEEFSRRFEAWAAPLIAARRQLVARFRAMSPIDLCEYADTVAFQPRPRGGPGPQGDKVFDSLDEHSIRGWVLGTPSPRSPMQMTILRTRPDTQEQLIATITLDCAHEMEDRQ